MALSKKMMDYVCNTAQEAMELLTTLAKIPAPSNHEEKRAEFCRDWFLKAGAKDVYIDDALNVVCKLGECNDEVDVFMAHSDVVFPDLEELPLSVTEERICCPGIGDNTTSIIALLMAARYAISEQLQPRRSGLLIVINSGEEGLGNLKGSRKIMEDYGDRIHHFYTIDGWNGKMINIAVGSRRFRVTIETEGGHSYNAFGNRNAIAYMASMIDALYTIKPPTGTSYNVGVIQGGTSVNTIAQKAEMLYEFRSDRMDAMEQMQAHFDACVSFYRQKGVRIEVEVLGERPCTGDVDAVEQQKMMDKTNQAYQDYFGCEAQFGSGSTDCNIPLSRGIPSLCLACYNGEGAHSREEYVLIDSLLPGRKLVMDIMMSYFA